MGGLDVEFVAANIRQMDGSGHAYPRFTSAVGDQSAPARAMFRPGPGFALNLD
jgi:hypothetical protein